MISFLNYTVLFKHHLWLHFQMKLVKRNVTNSFVNVYLESYQLVDCVGLELKKTCERNLIKSEIIVQEENNELMTLEHKHLYLVLDEHESRGYASFKEEGERVIKRSLSD